MTQSVSDEFIEELRQLLDKYGAIIFLDMDFETVVASFYDREIRDVDLGRSFHSRSIEKK